MNYQLIATTILHVPAVQRALRLPLRRFAKASVYSGVIFGVPLLVNLHSALADDTGNAASPSSPQSESSLVDTISDSVADVLTGAVGSVAHLVQGEQPAKNDSETATASPHLRSFVASSPPHPVQDSSAGADAVPVAVDVGDNGSTAADDVAPDHVVSEGPPVVQEEEQSEEDPPCQTTARLRLRLISVHGGINVSLGEAAGAKVRKEFDGPLVDLQMKLKDLPFQKFHQILDADEEVTHLHRETVHLPNGQSLGIRPLEISDSMVTIWLKWFDKDDMAILNTRVSLPYGEGMIAGVEGGEDEGVVLVVEPVK